MYRYLSLQVGFLIGNVDGASTSLETITSFDNSLQILDELKGNFFSSMNQILLYFIKEVFSLGFT